MDSRIQYLANRLGTALLALSLLGISAQAQTEKAAIYRNPAKNDSSSVGATSLGVAPTELFSF